MGQRHENGASAKEGEGAGRGPCGLRNSELGPLPHNLHNYALEKTTTKTQQHPLSPS